MIFKKIRFKNLLSYGNLFTEIVLNAHKTTLIVGKNGHGKSALIDAISFVLFGRAFRNINKNKLVNSITKKNCLVEIEFEANKKEYMVRRGINPEVFEIYENGHLMPKPSTMTEYQETLQSILKINYKAFFQICVLGKANFAPFMSLDATKRREIVENLLDIQVFSLMNVLLKTDTDQNKKKMTDVETEIKVCTKKLEVHEQHVRKLSQNNDALILAKQEKIKEYADLIKNFSKEIAERNKQIKEKKETIADQEKIEKKLSSLNTLKRKLNEKLSKLKEDIEFFTNNGNCPVCKQEINEDFKNTTVEHKNKHVKEVDDGLVELLKQQEEASTRLKEISIVNNEIDKLNKEISSNNNQIFLNNQLIYSVNQEIRQLKQKVENESEEDIEKTKKELDNHTEIKNNLLEEKEVLDTCGFLLKDSGIKSRVIKKYIPIMNKLINKYLSALDFFVNFELSETFEETIKSRYRDEFSYYSFSEGEKFRIDIAILLCWRAIAKQRNSFSSNLLLLDECFDSSLDTAGIDDFIKILKSLPDDVNIFLISHKVDQLVDKFNKVITVEKKKNFSGVKE